MPFFNQQAANIIQLLSLPIEVLGLAMILVELKDPKLADRYERELDLIAKNPMDHQAFITLFPFVGTPLFLISGVVWFLTVEFTWWKAVAGFLVSWLIAGILGPVFSLELAMLVRLLHKFTEERALGAVGLLLAGIGVLGETYQVLTIFFG